MGNLFNVARIILGTALFNGIVFYYDAIPGWLCASGIYCSLAVVTHALVKIRNY